MLLKKRVGSMDTQILAYSEMRKSDNTLVSKIEAANVLSQGTFYRPIETQYSLKKMNNKKSLLKSLNDRYSNGGSRFM